MRYICGVAEEEGDSLRSQKSGYTRLREGEGAYAHVGPVTLHSAGINSGYLYIVAGHQVC